MSETSKTYNVIGNMHLTINEEKALDRLTDCNINKKYIYVAVIGGALGLVCIVLAIAAFGCKDFSQNWHQAAFPLSILVVCLQGQNIRIMGSLIKKMKKELDSQEFSARNLP